MTMGPGLLAKKIPKVPGRAYLIQANCDNPILGGQHVYIVSHAYL